MQSWHALEICMRNSFYSFYHFQALLLWVWPPRSWIIEASWKAFFCMTWHNQEVWCTFKAIGVQNMPFLDHCITELEKWYCLLIVFTNCAEQADPSTILDLFKKKRIHDLYSDSAHLATGQGILLCKLQADKSGPCQGCQKKNFKEISY